MGSTYAVQQRAAAMVAANGAIYYTLFEETYESNVFPQTPRWSANYFGTADACMIKAVLWSSAAEGGCLKGRSGNITPSGYLKKWRDALANPVTLDKTKVSAQIKEGFRTIEPAHKDCITSILARHGIIMDAEDKFEIDLVEQPEVLQEILDATNLGGWRFFESYNFTNQEAPWASYAPAKQKAKSLTDVHVFFAIPETNQEAEYWLVYPNGEVKHVGWEYSAIQGLITELATRSEKEVPGSAENALKQVRQIVTSEKLQFPVDSPITIYRDKAKSSWHISSFDDLAVQLGQPGTTQISTTLKEVLLAGAFFKLKYLSNEMIDYRQVFTPASIAPQLDLLAA